MADLQVGNVHGVAAVGERPAYLALVTAKGANTVTVDTLKGLYSSLMIDIADEDGAVVASNREITDFTDEGVITYSGADQEADIDVGFGVYLVGNSTKPAPKTNTNGGPNTQAGFVDTDMLTIEAMRARLTAIDGTAYSAANLNKMTENDMKYALRVHDNPTSLKQ